MNILKECRDEVIPVRQFTYYVHALNSDYLKLLMVVYHDLKTKNHWTRQDIETLKELQQRIKEESYSLYKTAWENKVEKLNRIYKDAEKFWKGIGSMMSNAKEVSDYILIKKTTMKEFTETKTKRKCLEEYGGTSSVFPIISISNSIKTTKKGS